MSKWIYPALCALLAGCVTTPEPVIEVRTVNVAVPIPCRSTEPQRPAMPMDDLQPGISLDQFVAHALAEREVREGYEGELRAALHACIEKGP